VDQPWPAKNTWNLRTASSKSGRCSRRIIDHPYGEHPLEGPRASPPRQLVPLLIMLARSTESLRPGAAYRPWAGGDLHRSPSFAASPKVAESFSHGPAEPPGPSALPPTAKFTFPYLPLHPLLLLLPPRRLASRRPAWDRDPRASHRAGFAPRAPRGSARACRSSSSTLLVPEQILDHPDVVPALQNWRWAGCRRAPALCRAWSPAALRTAPSADRTAPAADRTAPAALRTAPSHDRTAPAALRTAPAADRTAPAADRTSPAADRTSPAADRTSPAADRTAPADDRTAPSALPTAPSGSSWLQHTHACLHCLRVPQTTFEKKEGALKKNPPPSVSPTCAVAPPHLHGGCSHHEEPARRFRCSPRF
jgi:hypothetical protein